MVQRTVEKSTAVEAPGAEALPPKASPDSSGSSGLGKTRPSKAPPGRYLVTAAALVVAGFLGIWKANKSFAPEMYHPDGPKVIAEALARNLNYAVFDLNINIRELRDHHIARLDYTPDVVVLGASHWQEAHSGLISHKRFYNAHVHRDYYEDMLAVTELFVRHNRLPKQMIIAIRDNLFAPISARRDHLWLPGIPYYRAMAERLGLVAHPELDTLPMQRWRELISLPMLHGNVARWYNAAQKPHATSEHRLPDLDVLLPGGSIVWSESHSRSFTPELAESLSAEFAASRINNPPRIEKAGVDTIDALLTFLRQRNVEILLAHPPFNPAFYERVEGTPYMAGLKAVEEVTRQLAQKHGAQVIGSFDPAALGCDRSMYIDAEHSNSNCLGRLLDQFTAFDRSRTEAAVAMVSETKPGRGVKTGPANQTRGKPGPRVEASAGVPTATVAAGASDRSKSASKNRRKRESQAKPKASQAGKSAQARTADGRKSGTTNQ
jgi:hypothetical protein